MKKKENEILTNIKTSSLSSEVKQEKIASSLFLRAIGFDICDTTEEFSVGEDGNLILTKKKITTKHIPPDISAGKALLEFYFNDACSGLAQLTDEELLSEKKRILKLIQNLSYDEKIPDISENLNVEN